MLEIEGKVYRNLQEQVGWLTKELEKILDGHTEDLVVLEEPSGDLTTEQLNKLLLFPAFAKHDGKLFIKTTRTKLVGTAPVIVTENGLVKYYEDTINFNAETGVYAYTRELKMEINIEEKATVYEGTYIGDETQFVPEMKEGDIIVETTGGLYSIKEIAFSGNALTKVVLLGFKDNATPTKEIFESYYGTWSSVDYNPVPALLGKYVRIMDAPTSTTLTDEQIEIIKEGVFINDDFLNTHNPVLYPLGTQGYGIIYGMGTNYDNFEIAHYNINSSTKVISKSNQFIVMLRNGTMNLKNVGFLNEKQIPAYPSDTGTFVLKCVNGTLTWVAE